MNRVPIAFHAEFSEFSRFRERVWRTQKQRFGFAMRNQGDRSAVWGGCPKKLVVVGALARLRLSGLNMRISAVRES